MAICLKTGFNLGFSGGVYRADLFVEGDSLFAVANTSLVAGGDPDLVVPSGEVLFSGSRNVKVVFGPEIEITDAFLCYLLKINPGMLLSSFAHKFTVVERFE